MSKNKKIIFGLAILATTICIFFIVNIYAKYLTTATGDTSITISRWNILVNNTSIRDNSDISASIVPVFPGNNNIAANIIAPTAEGYFDLAFDFTNVDVSFKYDITTDVSESSYVKDLVATGYSIDGGEVIPFADGNAEHITDTIPINSNIKSRLIRVYIKWDDSESSTMNNASDTISTTNGNRALYNVNIALTQVVD